MVFQEPEDPVTACWHPVPRRVQELNLKWQIACQALSGCHPHTHIPSPCAMLCPLLAINSEAERPLPGSAILKCQEQNKQEQAAGMHSLVTRCIQAGAWKEELRVRMAWERGCLLWKLHLQQKWEQLTQKAASPAWKKNKTSCCFQISYFLHV